MPPPKEDETFLPYVKRLGLKPEPLVAGLDQRTIEIANVRLGSRLQEAMRPAFSKYIDKLAEQHLTPERRRHIRNEAFNVFGLGWRRPTQ